MIRMLCLGFICIIVLTSCNSIGGSKGAKQYLDYPTWLKKWQEKYQ
jgi:hypothetical protein